MQSKEASFMNSKKLEKFRFFIPVIYAWLNVDGVKKKKIWMKQYTNEKIPCAYWHPHKIKKKINDIDKAWDSGEKLYAYNLLLTYCGVIPEEFKVIHILQLILLYLCVYI